MKLPIPIAVCLVLCVSSFQAAAEAAVDSDDSITIYSRLQAGAVAPELYRPVAGRQQHGSVPGYAIVRHDRRFDIARGISTLRVSDVAALIDPTTVTFTSLDEPRTRVLEQSFQFDLVSQQKLLERYLDREIVVEQARGEFVDRTEGLLLGIGDGLTLQLDDGSVQAIRSYSSLHFPQLPGGLITHPTLEWLLDSPVGGAQKARLAYETGGMTWWADYNVIYHDTAICTLDLSAWVSIINRSGAAYPNARLKLIAGDVHRAEQPRARREALYAMTVEEEAPGFREKAFFEYHLYTLGRRTDLPDNSTRQLQLFPTARGVGCQKELVYAPTLNTPYPGHQQLNQEYGRRGSLEFIGEDVIDHTPRNEDVLIQMGNAFDVVGERVQTDFRVDTRSHNLWESFEIRLRNHKDEAVEVAVLENLYRTANWKIENANRQFGKENSNRIRFDVTVESEAEAVIRYTAHYSW